MGWPKISQQVKQQGGAFFLFRFPDPKPNGLWIQRMRPAGQAHTWGEGRLAFGQPAMPVCWCPPLPEHILSQRTLRTLWTHRDDIMQLHFKSTLGQVQCFWSDMNVYKCYHGPSVHKNTINGCQPPLPTGEAVLERQWYVASPGYTSSRDKYTPTENKGALF